MPAVDGSFSQKQLSELQARQGALKRITQAMAKVVELDPQPVFDAALREVAQALGGPMTCLHLHDDEGQVLHLVAGHNLDPVWSMAWRRLSLAGPTPPARAQTSGRTVEVMGGEAPMGLAGVVSSPVQGAELTVGTLSVLWPGSMELPLDLECADFLETAGYLLGISIEHAGLVAEMVDYLGQVSRLQKQAEQRSRELAVLNDKLAELSITDDLTGLSNRRYFLQRLEEELRRSRRLGRPMCLVMADLDHFKKVNDRLGHQAGDRALAEFAAHLREGVREVDLVGRYGGEEFALALLDCDIEAGARVADKLRKTLRPKTLRPPFDQLGGFTVSMGVAQAAPGMEAGELIARADRALYRAKENGRDRVESA